MPAGIVVGQAGEQSRSDHSQQSAEGKPFAYSAIHGVAPPPVSRPPAGA